MWEEHKHEEAEDIGGQEEHAAFENLRGACVFADARDDEAGNADGRRYRAKRRDEAGSYPRCVMSGWKSGREIIKKANESIRQPPIR